MPFSVFNLQIGQVLFSPLRRTIIYTSFPFTKLHFNEFAKLFECDSRFVLNTHWHKCKHSLSLLHFNEKNRSTTKSSWCVQLCRNVFLFKCLCYCGSFKFLSSLERTTIQLGSELIRMLLELQKKATFSMKKKILFYLLFC